MLRCAILDDYQRVVLAIAPWHTLADRVDFRVLHDHLETRAQLADAIGDCEIVVATRERTRFDDATLELLPRLRLLVTTGARNAAIDLAAASRRNVTVCGTRGWPGHTVELTFALMLGLMRRLREETAAFARGAWKTGVGRSLNGATLGVVGVGQIGAKVARIARGFDMRVIGWSRSLTRERCAELDIEHAAALDDLLRTADVVSLHVALNDGTRGLLGARELALMKRDAILVNTARGPVVDEPALIEALSERRIGGAALDVFDQEPLPDGHPLWTEPRALITPHVANTRAQLDAALMRRVEQNVARFRAGEPLLGVIDSLAGY